MQRQVNDRTNLALFEEEKEFNRGLEDLYLMKKECETKFLSFINHFQYPFHLPFY